MDAKRATELQVDEPTSEGVSNLVTSEARVVGPVCSHNEWDPLDEVIVGVADGAAIPRWEPALAAAMPASIGNVFRSEGGRRVARSLVAAANDDLEAFVELLRNEGVVVRRPLPVDHATTYSTPYWESSGLYATMPRDLLLVVGDEIIETPMAWRSRYFEIRAYRPLLRAYFETGARWTAAPKPLLQDAMYLTDYEYSLDADTDEPNYVLTELEPTFDAADVVRCGRDLFVQRSQVTNRAGIGWLRRHLGDEYTVHEVRTYDAHALHIDATFMPLAPGKLLVNPERVRDVPSVFDSWDVRFAPTPSPLNDDYVNVNGVRFPRLGSRWLSMNVLMLDEKRVFVEKDDTGLADFLATWDFEPILCPFRHFHIFGGSFHCATLDVRRRGGLATYF